MKTLQEIYQYVFTLSFLFLVIKTWLPAGLVAAAIFHDYASKEAAPWGDSDGQKQFWILIIFGWLSVFVALYSCVYVRVGRISVPKKKKSKTKPKEEHHEYFH